MSSHQEPSAGDKAVGILISLLCIAGGIALTIYGWNTGSSSLLKAGFVLVGGGGFFIWFLSIPSD